MIAAVVVHALLVGGLLTLAAWSLETVVRGRGWAARWAWTAALAGSALGSGALLLQRAGGQSAPPSVFLDGFQPVGMASEGAALSLLGQASDAWRGFLDAVATTAGAVAGWVGAIPGLDTALGIAWGALALGAALVVAGAAVRLHRGTRHLPTRIVEGRVVAVSEALGPAVVGFARPRIVLPRWLLSSPRDLLATVLLHEEEHVRARDTLLLALGLGLVVLMPWNPVLWYQLRRLRLAIEVDCDRRVVRRGVSPTRYAALLLEVGTRSTLLRPAVAALAEPPSLLERRMKALCTPLPRIPAARSALSAAAALVLVVAACEVPTPAVDSLRSLNEGAPVEPREETPSPAPSASPAPEAGDPTFTPYTLAPQLRNVAEVTDALQREYPPLLRDAGIGGQVLVHFRIDQEGTVTDVRVARTSGHQALDAAALRVGAVFRFSPAMNGDEAVPVWIALPITFRTRDTEAAHAESRTRAGIALLEEALRTGRAQPVPPPSPAPDLTEGPTFTPYTMAPQLRNTSVVQEALTREYPPLLRDAGIGGQALVHVLVDAEGAVTDARVSRESGHAALDAAALRVARTFRFAPARNGDEPVPVWIALPIRFQAP